MTSTAGSGIGARRCCRYGHDFVKYFTPRGSTHHAHMGRSPNDECACARDGELEVARSSKMGRDCHGFLLPEMWCVYHPILHKVSKLGPSPTSLRFSSLDAGISAGGGTTKLIFRSVWCTVSSRERIDIERNCARSQLTPCGLSGGGKGSKSWPSRFSVDVSLRMPER